MHFSLIKASDMVLVDSQGYVVEGGNHAMINEAGFWIHSEVHHARPDVMAVAHAHSQYGRAWSAFGKPIEMLDQGGLSVRIASFVELLLIYLCFQILVICMERSVSTVTTAVLHLRKKKVELLRMRLGKTAWLAFYKIMGMYCLELSNTPFRIDAILICRINRLITCGTTVDEAAFLFYDLDRACHTQLMVEAAAANGLQKKVIPHEIAQYSARSMQSAVS